MTMIRILADRDADRGRYLGEMLSLWGVNGWMITDDAPASDEGPIVVLVPPGVVPPRSALQSTTDSGGHLILVAPEPATCDGLDLDCEATYGDDGDLSFLRLNVPLLHSYSHHSIPVLGRRAPARGAHYQASDFRRGIPDGARILACLFDPDQGLTDRPAIWTVPRGRGSVTVLAYDAVACYRNLRQGSPACAGWRPAFDDICRPAYLFGPRWRATFQSGHLPLADFHPMLLVRLVEQLLDVPMPRFWQLPGTCRSAILVSGDEDGVGPQCTEEICSFVESLGGKFTSYILMETTSTTPDQVRSWIDRGHGFSVHPYPNVPGDFSRIVATNPIEALASCVDQFRRRFELPTPNVRNHRLYWSGYADIPRRWNELGVAMDVNYISGTLTRSFESYYSAPAAALPIPFADESFRIIDVLQQPVASNDDADFGPSLPKSKCLSPESFEAYGEALLARTLEPFGLPFAYIFHQGNFATYAGEAERRFLRLAHRRSAALMSDHEWLEFWQARQRWRIGSMEATDQGWRYRLEGARGAHPVSVSLPVNWRERPLTRVEVDGASVEPPQIDHFGEQRILIQLPEGADEVVVDAC